MGDKKSIYRPDISILLSGEAGQGIQTLERLLMKMFKRTGRFVYSFSEFMSRIRGGNNSTEIRVSSQRVAAYCDRIDIFIPFGPGAMDRFHERITPESLIIGDPDFIDERFRTGQYQVVDIHLSKIAREVGGKTFMNLIVMGIFAGIFDVDDDSVEKQIREHFSRVPSDVLEKNLAAVRRGTTEGHDLAEVRRIPVPAGNNTEAQHAILINGAESIAFGGIAGGCNFVSSYPMSPSTDVLVNFAKYSCDFGIIVEQAEDEISAVNMAIGSWYAGGRAMVTTSGGGFALMTEGLSLAGAIESPLVIHVGQRPGPATGMPTRTEQGDLLFSLFSGHGEFLRAVFAPGNFSQGFNITQRAFYISDRCQVPALILTDQYFLDSNYTIPEVTIESEFSKNYIVETDAGYRRYAQSPDGISPRGIPGFGRGIICADSDEHDEGGYITEDFQVRVEQVNKRMRKTKMLHELILPPDLYGPRDYTHLIIAWGSTLESILEAIDLSGVMGVSLLHFTQVFPLHEDTANFISKARKAAVVENNYTSQFARLIRMETGIDISWKILKYNGLPFTVEELANEIKKFVQE